MENLEKYWGMAAAIGGMIVLVLSWVLSNINVPEPGAPVPTWRKVVQIIVAIVGRIFSISTVKNRGDKEGFELKLPIVQSAMPNKVPPPKAK